MCFFINDEITGLVTGLITIILPKQWWAWYFEIPITKATWYRNSHNFYSWQSHIIVFTTECNFFPCSRSQISWILSGLCGPHFKNPCTRASICWEQKEGSLHDDQEKKGKDWNGCRFVDGHKKWRRKIMREVSRMWMGGKAWQVCHPSHLLTEYERVQPIRYRLLGMRICTVAQNVDFEVWHPGLNPSPAI